MGAIFSISALWLLILAFCQNRGSIWQCHVHHVTFAVRQCPLPYQHRYQTLFVSQTLTPMSAVTHSLDAPKAGSKRQKSAPSSGTNESLTVETSLGELPIDVLTEILRRLEPVTLLVLLRTSRSLRALLLNRSTASLIWKHASHYP